MNEHDVIDFILDNGILIFGSSFKLKSGLSADHFYDFGKVNSSSKLTQLANYMNSNIYGEEYTVLFTSAYKGIMLSTALLIECGNDYPSIDFKMGFLRKEKKDHGEMSDVVGYYPKPSDTVVLVDDVLTSGQSLLEMADFIRSTGAKIESAIVIVMRAPEARHEEIAGKLGCPIRYLTTDEAVLKVYSDRLS